MQRLRLVLALLITAASCSGIQLTPGGDAVEIRQSAGSECHQVGTVTAQGSTWDDPRSRRNDIFNDLRNRAAAAGGNVVVVVPASQFSGYSEYMSGVVYSCPPAPSASSGSVGGIPPQVSSGESKPPAVTLTGTWSGTASDSTGPGSMKWVVNQAGSKISGNVEVTAGSRTIKGKITGLVSGEMLTYSVSLPVAGLKATYGTCSVTMNGTAVASTSKLLGTYSGLNSCEGPFSNGELSLTKAP